VLKKTIGITFDNGAAHVRVWVPEAAEVAIKLAKTGEVFPLNQQPRGYWGLETEKIQRGDRYYIVIDGDRELPDPASVSQPDGVHGASQALRLDFA